MKGIHVLYFYKHDLSKDRSESIGACDLEQKQWKPKYFENNNAENKTV